MEHPLKLRQRSLHLNALLSVIAASIIGSTLGSVPSAQAAEKVVFTYGQFGQSLTLDELKTFAETGQPSRKLRFFINASKQDPAKVQSFLKKDIKIGFRTLDQVLNFLPAEYVLYEVGQIIHTPARKANIQALRSAIVLSATDDSKLSVLEFIERYPTRELYIDGLQLTKTNRRIQGLIRNAKTTLDGPAAFLKDLLCDCAPKSSEPEAP